MKRPYTKGVVVRLFMSTKELEGVVVFCEWSVENVTGLHHYSRRETPGTSVNPTYLPTLTPVLERRRVPCR